MPRKICPNCNKTHGNRTKQCPCGHVFIAGKTTKKATSTDKAKPALGMGLWALDKSKDLPKIEPPDPLPSGKLSLEQVKEYIVYEGLGFCIYEYINPTKIDDDTLRKLWKEAKQAMQKIQEYLYDS